MKLFKFFLLISVYGIAFLTGCTAVDLTQKHKGAPPLCEIHKIEMHPERISVYDDYVNIQNYVDYAKKNFPNHGGHFLNHEKTDTGWERDVIDYVCTKCDETYKAYWKEKK